MTPQRRFGTAILLSVAAHALLLSAVATDRTIRHEPFEAGRLTVSLQRGGAEPGQAPKAAPQSKPEAVATSTGFEDTPPPAQVVTNTSAHSGTAPAKQPAPPPVRDLSLIHI